MELITEEKKGLKRTEVGLIPKDWEIENLVNLSTITRLAGAEYSSVWEEDETGEIIALRGYNIGKNRIIERDFARISDSLSRNLSRSRLQKGDVVYPCVGSIGNAVVINENNKYHIQQNIARIIPNKRADSSYIAYYLMSPIGLSEIKRFNATSSQPNVLVGSLRQYRVPLPPTLEEQEAIATALSDVDELIRSLDRLIQKKEAIKKGTMQQLLTGKKRLSGFDGVWEVKRLGEIGFTINGLSGKTKADFGDGNHPYITFMNVMSNTVIDTSIFDTVKVRRGESQSEIKKGDLLFNTSSETPEEVGMCSVLLKEIENLHLNSFCFGYRIHEQDEVLPIFLAYYFRSEFGRKHMQALAQGSTRYNLSKSKFVKIEVELPEFEEQKAIAQILSDMDRELQTLRQKREKYKQVKQGMMQELLTGKVRLV